MVCAKCGQELKDDEMICPRCDKGHKIIVTETGETIMVCTECGNKIQNGETSCSYCNGTGKPINKKPEEAIKVWVCETCGRKLRDRETPCPYCDAKKTFTTITNKYYKQNGMIEFIRMCFPWVFSVMFCFFVIGGMASGAAIGRSLASYKGDWIGYMTLGGMIGLVIGFFNTVWVYGIVATILKIDENLQYLADKEKSKGDK